MRILSIAFALATLGDAAVGGAEQVLTQIDRELVAAGHESSVVAAAGSKIQGELFATAAGPELITKPYYTFRYVEHSRKINEALNSGPVDLVHMHGFDFYEFIPQGHIPVLATLHLPPQWYPNWIFRNQRPNFYLNCVSNSQRRTVVEPTLIARTVENGVRIPPAEPLPCRERNGAVILGRICPEKGTHLAIEAARKAAIALTIAGRVFGYPEHMNYFEHQIRPVLGHGVTLIGPIAWSGKIHLLRSAKCVLVPSVAPETSSLVSMEALACGTPVIAMNSGALPEIVEHGRTGFIVNNVEEMADAIARVDQIDPATCRQRAIERFSAYRMAREYISLYKALIASSKPELISHGGSVAESEYPRTA